VGGDPVAPYIGAAVAVPHDGMNLPPWAMTGAALTVVAHGSRLPRARSLQRTVSSPVAGVGHGDCVANRRGARRLVARSAKISNGRIILQND
jgi:hypothetical protein